MALPDVEAWARVWALASEQARGLESEPVAGQAAPWVLVWGQEAAARTSEQAVRQWLLGKAAKEPPEVRATAQVRVQVPGPLVEVWGRHPVAVPA